jgi:NAD(P)-dependent dehydrogenase (short-subunit alcohol dehydrogenase family)
MPALDGKVVVVTGANAGLGLAAAQAFGRKGARVLLACRNQEKAAAAAEQIEGEVALVPLDLGSLASVAACAGQVLDQEDRLDLLINNAGLMAIDHATTEDGFEMQLGVNHLGHFALTARLAPLLLSTPGSRVVSMSSFGHRPGRLHLDDLMFERRGYSRWPAYFQSKLANILFTLELQRRLAAAGAGTEALVAHPGGTHTDLGTEGSGITNKLNAPVMKLMQSTAMGALPLLRAATDPEAKGGQFYGPRWMARGHPRLERPSRRARNAADAKALWERSEALTGVTPAFRP